MPLVLHLEMCIGVVAFRQLHISKQTLFNMFSLDLSFMHVCHSPIDVVAFLWSMKSIFFMPGPLHQFCSCMKIKGWNPFLYVSLQNLPPVLIRVYQNQAKHPKNYVPVMQCKGASKSEEGKRDSRNKYIQQETFLHHMQYFNSIPNNLKLPLGRLKSFVKTKVFFMKRIDHL